MDEALPAGLADLSADGATPWRPRGADWLVAAIVVLLGQIDVWVHGLAIANMVGPAPVNAACYFACSVTLVWRRRAPLAVLALIVSISSVQYLAVGASEGLGAFLPLLIAFYALGRYADIRTLVAGAPLAMLGLAIHELRDPVFDFGGSTVTFWIVLAAAWPLGQAFRRRQQAADVLSARTRSLERDQDRTSRAAAAAERARIARELHDVVGHAVSLVVLQAVAALGLLDRGDSRQVRGRLSTIEATARDALAEMRRLLELLDEDEAETDGVDSATQPIHPPPGLARLSELTGQVRDSGLPVELSIRGDLDGLPPGLDLAAYRIVQEALTNTVKHADAAQAVVTVSRSRNSLEIQVVDDGRSRPVLDHRGRGVSGMRQRARLYDGTVDIGPKPDGGFRVRAEFPLACSTAVPAG